MNSTSTTVVRRISRLKRRRPCSNSVSGDRLPSRTAMSPNIVFGPVAMASAVPVPLTTDVPRNTRCGAFGISRGVRRGRWRVGEPSCRPAATRRSASIAGRRDRATRAAARRRAPGRRPTVGRRRRARRSAAASRATPRPGSTVAVGLTDDRSRSAACCER